MPQSIFPPAGIYANRRLNVDIRYVDNVHSPVIDIANLSVILDNNLTDLLDSVKGLDFPFDIIVVSDTWL